jgi:hypothetical protein
VHIDRGLEQRTTTTCANAAERSPPVGGVPWQPTPAATHRRRSRLAPEIEPVSPELAVMTRGVGNGRGRRGERGRGTATQPSPPRLLHAILWYGDEPPCRRARGRLLPTFKRWPGGLRPGVKRCITCAHLVPGPARRRPRSGTPLRAATRTPPGRSGSAPAPCRRHRPGPASHFTFRDQPNRSPVTWPMVASMGHTTGSSTPGSCPVGRQSGKPADGGDRAGADNATPQGHASSETTPPSFAAFSRGATDAGQGPSL